jgi:hypothetical protein
VEEQRKASDRGPIWRDVSELLATMYKRWGGNWVLSVRANPAGVQNGHLWVLCEVTLPTGRTGLSKQLRAGRKYPTSDGLSMPAVMHGLLYDVEGRFEDDRGLAERQASF